MRQFINIDSAILPPFPSLGQGTYEGEKYDLTVFSYVP